MFSVSLLAEYLINAPKTYKNVLTQWILQILRLDLMIVAEALFTLHAVCSFGSCDKKQIICRWHTVLFICTSRCSCSWWICVYWDGMSTEMCQECVTRKDKNRLCPVVRSSSKKSCCCCLKYHLPDCAETRPLASCWEKQPDSHVQLHSDTNPRTHTRVSHMFLGHEIFRRLVQLVPNAGFKPATAQLSVLQVQTELEFPVN